MAAPRHILTRPVDPSRVSNVLAVLCCRVDAFIVCQAGDYVLRTGFGPFGNDPECQSSHCQLRNQSVLATISVVCTAPPAILIMT